MLHYESLESVESIEHHSEGDMQSFDIKDNHEGMILNFYKIKI